MFYFDNKLVQAINQERLQEAEKARFAKLASQMADGSRKPTFGRRLRLWLGAQFSSLRSGVSDLSGAESVQSCRSDGECLSYT
jgi:hypothetical protein